MAHLPPDLAKEKEKICKIAKGYQLDFFETIFEIVNYEQIHQIAAYGGFPIRYSHWRFGMGYDQISKGHEYGLSKIYEMVINTNPCIAYLMLGNSFLSQKLVMAHVYAHCDFFKNNYCFAKTNRKMIDAMANHAVRVRRYIERYGIHEVESFIDKCLSLENLIYPHDSHGEPSVSGNLKESSLLNTKDSNASKELSRWNASEGQGIFNRDVLNFLMHYAPLREWEQDILGIVREEARYFIPQGMTKTMNEGWASYWHAKIMTQCLLKDSEVIDYADHHSSVVAMGDNNYNPYKVGIELFRDIEDRWNKGKFGAEWDSCNNIMEKRNWNKKLNQGREKIFQVRKIYNDVTFIDTFLTEDFCRRQNLFVYKYSSKKKTFEMDSRDFKAIKAKLLFLLTNLGQPIIGIEDANYNNRGILLFGHKHEEVDLQPDYMEGTMKNIYSLWKRPVYLKTKMEEEGLIFSYDGNKFEQCPL